MFNQEACLGTSCGMDKLRMLSDELNAKVVEQINGSQELVMLTSFARESNEYQFKKCLQNRYLYNVLLLIYQSHNITYISYLII